MKACHWIFKSNGILCVVAATSRLGKDYIIADLPTWSRKDVRTKRETVESDIKDFYIEVAFVLDYSVWL